MRIIELILDEAQSMMGIEAISIVENPAIEENFLALKSDEIKLAEVNKEKKILMGALLIPNKPIYRKSGEDEYYIYFSKDTVEKASQLYLKNGNQNNSTLEHKHELNGLTLVESWIVEDEKFDKSRKYGLNVPVGTWMGAVKVNNDDVWNEYVKTGKVKGFSIEGYFADKMERPKDNTTGLSEQKADLLLSEITSIVKGEKVELNSVKDISKYETKLKEIQKGIREYEQFKQSTKPEILKIVKWLNQLKAAILQIGLSYKDVKGLNEVNDLYWKVNAEAKSSKII
ncbi:MAG: putative peptidase [Prokaryotic dsDNA virus sp.]|nr:MAG: putative peptidase [Prokaryotic dsDNA virus sp.]|tara:strand:+ start:20435 stop:21289 length:855 start_codon:yes stop_codon:yes gene_type:complete